ncbi:NAD(P)-dependent oxidoreductase, partial [Francisella tularensis]
MIKLACTFIWLLRNYFCAQTLNKMKKGAYLINTARAKICDTQA